MFSAGHVPAFAAALRPHESRSLDSRFQGTGQRNPLLFDSRPILCLYLHSTCRQFTLSFLENRLSRKGVQRRGGRASPTRGGPAAAWSFGPDAFLPVSFEGAPECHPGPGDAAAVLGTPFLELGQLRREALRKNRFELFHCLELVVFPIHDNLPFRHFYRMIDDQAVLLSMLPLRSTSLPSAASLRNKKRPGPELSGPGLGLRLTAPKRRPPQEGTRG